MNESPHHSKIRVMLTLGNTMFVAGEDITGKMDIECRADKGLGLGTIMIELLAVQELTSRDHAATSTFMHTKRLFQGPSLPPSNAVLPHSVPQNPPLPPHYHPARKGQTTFFFKFPLPLSAPSSINFGNGLAKIRYELKASVYTAWKGEKKAVTDIKEADVVEAFEEEPIESRRDDVVKVAVGEGGKVWAQGKIVGGFAIAGQPACCELHIKNHSIKKTTSLTLTLIRYLHLPHLQTLNPGQKPQLHISDTLLTIPFKGAEYTVPAGGEGVANLVFDVPKIARGVRGGLREDDAGGGPAAGGKVEEALFEVGCVLSIKVGMGIGIKDLVIELPVKVYHPTSIPCPAADPYAYGYYPPYAPLPPPQPPYAASQSHPPSPQPQYNPYPPTPPISDQPFYSGSPPVAPYGALPYISPQNPQYVSFAPPPLPYALPPPIQSGTPPYFPGYPTFDMQYQHYAPIPLQSQYNNVQPPQRPRSADPYTTTQPPPPALPQISPDVSTNVTPSKQPVGAFGNPADVIVNDGRGDRASRISRHLRLSSRHRSVSPRASVVRVPLPIQTHTQSRIAQPQPHPTSSGFLATPLPNPHSPTKSRRLSLSASSQGGSPTSPIVISPRPIISPRPSFSHDVVREARGSGGTSRSDRVEQLERMVAEEEDKDKGNKEAKGVDKTLPGLPERTGVRAKPKTSPIPRASDVFGIIANADKSKVMRNEGPSKKEAAAPALGLEALERRLMGAKPDGMGEQTMKKPEKVHHHRGDPLTVKVPTETSDHAAKRRSPSKPSPTSPTQQRKNSADSPKSVDAKELEALKLRKAAKDRVQDWLLSSAKSDDLDVQPPTSVLPITVDNGARSPRSANKELGPGPVPHTSPFARARSPPVKTVPPPITAEKKKPTKQLSTSPPKETPSTVAAAITDAWKDEPPSAAKHRKPVPTLDPPSEGKASVPPAESRKQRPPPSSAPVVDRLAIPPSTSQPFKVAKKLSPSFPPPVTQPDGPKYDVRSARGGRGGVVTSVAALWASVVAEEMENAKGHPPPPLSKLPPPLKIGKSLPTIGEPIHPQDPLKESLEAYGATPTHPSPPDPRPAADANDPRPVRRGHIAPIVVNGTIAKPVLSTSASLARPIPRPPPPVERQKFLASIPESSTDNRAGAPKAGVPDLQFGQAKLRDLIKKYQNPEA